MTPLTATEAAAFTERAQSAADTLAHLLTVLHDGEAWRALKYPSWTAYVTDKFDVSLRTIQRYIRQERIRELLAGHVNLSRFSNAALEALAAVDEPHIRLVADIAADNGGKQVSAADIKAVQLGAVETLTLGAVDIGGEQYAVKDALALSVQASERERVNASREYLAANVEAEVLDTTLMVIRLQTHIPNCTSAPVTIGERLHITIWRDAK